MSTQAQDTAVRAEVVVDAPLERAFAVFTEGFRQLRARAQHARGWRSPRRCSSRVWAADLYDRGVDGSECRWARVLGLTSRPTGW